MTELWEFQKFDKIPRLRRGLVITEKIDGTNGQVAVMERCQVPDKYLRIDPNAGLHLPFMHVTVGGCPYVMLAGSRKRWLTDQKQGDNYGFGRWVSDNREELVGLGPGRHYGEWWGAGIQRRYGMDRKVFSLFNTARWGEHNPAPECCSVVPVLAAGDFSENIIEHCLGKLAHGGSAAAPGFMKPEGIVIYMTEARRLFQITLENDGIPKSLAKPKKASTILKTSVEWLQDYPLTIIDPDGWDRSSVDGYTYSFDEERITLAEFKYRVAMSTIKYSPVAKKLLEDFNNDRN
jgi:hypothetical protein